MSQETKNPFFRNFSPAMNLMAMFSLIFLGSLVGEFIVFFIVKGVLGINIFTNPEALNNVSNPTVLTLQQVRFIIITITTFITAATIFRKHMEYGGQDYLAIKRGISLKGLGIVAMIFMLCFPVSNFLYYVNGLLDFSVVSPEVGEALKQMEQESNMFQNQMIMNDSISVFLLNFLSIAILSAIGEELVFRGIFQRLFTKMFRNVHVAVFISALLFSLIHMSYYGLLSRFFMGIVLGYIYVCTANIWYCILFHFFNNALGVTLTWLVGQGYDLDFFNMLGSGDSDKWIGLILLALITAFGFTQLKRLIHQDFADELRDY